MRFYRSKRHPGRTDTIEYRHNNSPAFTAQSRTNKSIWNCSQNRCWTHSNPDGTTSVDLWRIRGISIYFYEEISGCANVRRRHLESRPFVWFWYRRRRLSQQVFARRNLWLLVLYYYYYFVSLERGTKVLLLNLLYDLNSCRYCLRIIGMKA